ncbi:NUDIX hydrolase [Pseudonocardia sp. KRD-184]|uniref:NUDIX hydrolase n=1 Tax=Pseudonocardia oceani TaxID=2792013 RepID=A0ABS6UB89_9PSEU|nr:NUDIX hydrolase [Pseudonocardia oceani]MBW0100747.1 NUDIX hydrolase [Pseudonocardia oceani]MBW0108742.1 NUDIX hydrolase [Pseudonocardia oceani]MBW0126059.1 NUDIX hydrolase [Pseudonocardia oceani]MBW0129497.1 NUDIX hydrolase [Pseudonocardia oceani]
MEHSLDESGSWSVHGGRPVYRNEWVSVDIAEVELPSGERFEHHVVTLKPAAMTVVLDDSSEHVLMAWRHRFAPDLWNWELPGGLLDPGEAPAETAAREVEEETGYRPRSVEHLVTFEPNVGMVRNAHHVFVARGAEKVAEATELNEGTFEWVPLAEVPELIRAQKIVNSGSLVGLLHVLALSGPGAPTSRGE